MTCLTLLSGWAARGAAPVERIYISTDRTVYIAGDAVWCSLFCLDGNGSYSNESAVAYLELISTDGTAATAKIGLLEGRGAGSFRIPATAPTSTYRLVAYTAVNAREEGTPWMDGSRILTVFNTTSTVRVRDGVTLGERADERTSAGTHPTGSLQLSAPARIRRGAPVTLSLRNGGPAADISLSVYHEDDLQGAGRENSLGSFLTRIPGSVRLQPGASGVPEYDGEVISARVRGTVTDTEDNPSVATLSSAGAPSNLYIGRTEGSDRIRFYTSNIYGNREIVCEVTQLDRQEGYIEFESPFLLPDPGELPKLALHAGQRGDLVTRKAALRSEKDLRLDTLVTLMNRREDLLLESVACRRYHLDDYNRFPSVQEVFVEILPELALKKYRDGVWYVRLVQSDALNMRRYHTDHLLVMMDGVVLNDLDLLVNFDAMLIEDIDVYDQPFACGRVVYNGLVNVITKKNYVTALHFPPSVRVLDFQGVSYPVAYGGAVPEGDGQDLRQVLYWHPALALEADGSGRIELHAPDYAGRFKVVAEGLAADGTPIYQTFSFEVE